MANPKQRRRKPGARRYADYTSQMLEIAVNLVRNKTITSYEAEKQFGIPRRTIVNKVKKLHANPIGHPTELSDDDEKHIAEVVNVAAEFGSPLTLLDLRIVVFNYLQKNDKKMLFKGKMPGERWAKSFIERHNFTQRATQNIKKSRAAKTVEELNDYYHNLEITLKGVPACNILNFDETNLSDDPGSVKAIFKRGVKHPERVINFSKSSISVMFAASADGKCLPPYVVYKSEYLWDKWCKGGPPKAHFNRTKSGWFDMCCFDDWFKNIVIPWANSREGPKVVIGDNLASHLSVESIQLCPNYNIRFAFLPTNATHLTQPLDVAFFGPMKRQWREILTNYKASNSMAGTINKCHFPSLLNELIIKTQITSESNIRQGFAASGIFPFNPSRVILKIPNVTEENTDTFDLCLLEYLENQRKPQRKNTGPKKKVVVTPGKSISTEEAEELARKRQIKKNTKPKTETITNKKGKNSNVKQKEDKKKEREEVCVAKNKLVYPKSLQELCRLSINKQIIVTQSSADVFCEVCPLGGISKCDSQFQAFVAHNSNDLPTCLKSTERNKQSSRLGSNIKILSDIIIKEADKPDIPLPSTITSQQKRTNYAMKKDEDQKSKINTEQLKKSKHQTKQEQKKSVQTQKLKQVLKKKHQKNKKTNQRKLKNKYKDTSSSESDNSISLADTDQSECADMEQFIEQYIENVDPNSDASFLFEEYDDLTASYTNGDWIIVRFSAEKSLKHYVGTIISVQNNSIPMVKFVRKIKNVKRISDFETMFSYPNVEDSCPIHTNDIIRLLPPPTITRRGQIVFKVNFNEYNIQ